MARPITTAGTTLQESDPRRQYTDTEVDSGLTLMAIHGSPTRAAEALSQELGRKVSGGTLRNWRDNSYADRYLEIRRTVVPQIRQAIAARHEDAAKVALDKIMAGLERLNVEDIRQDDLGKTIQQLTVATGIHVDKASLLRDMPTVIVQHMDAEENLDAIARLAPGSVVDSTAVDVTEAEVVE